MLRNDQRTLLILLRAWAVVVGVVAACGWVSMYFGFGKWMGPLALAILLGLAIRWRKELWESVRVQASALVSWWPVTLVFGFILILALVYEPAVHDTLAYRLPRIRLWMQDGVLQWYEGADQRCNGLGRNWEWLGMAILQVFRSERLLVLPSLVSWILLSRILFTWAEDFAASNRAARWTAFVLCTSPIFVVQGCTTMNDLMAATLVAASVMLLITAWENDDRKQGGLDLVFSGLALSLATGVKPNFGTLGVLWALGSVLWLFRRGGFKILPWPVLAAALPLAIIGSGLPTLILNSLNTGGIMAQMDTGKFSVAPTNPYAGLVFGHVMFWWQCLQPVFNPFASSLNGLTSQIDAQFAEFSSRLRLQTKPFLFGESAKIGTFSTLLIVGGLFLAVRRRFTLQKRRFWLFLVLAVAGLVGISANFAVAIPYDLGRSSVGFLFPLLPMVFLGVGALKDERGAFLPPAIAIMSLVFTVFLLAFEPNRSLLPPNVKGDLVKLVWGEERAGMSRAFRHYRDRRYSGKELYERVSEGEASVGICLAGSAPTSPAWNYLPDGTEIRYYSARRVEKVLAAPERFFIVTGRIEDIGLLLERPEFEQLDKRIYLKRVSLGNTYWFLLKRKEERP